MEIEPEKIQIVKEIPKIIWEKTKFNLIYLVGKLMSRFKITRVECGMFHDPVTGNIIDVYVSPLFLRISVTGIEICKPFVCSPRTKPIPP